MQEMLNNIMTKFNLVSMKAIPKNILLTIGVFVIIWIFKKYSYKAIKRHTEDRKNQFMYRKIVGAIYTMLCIIILLVIWYDSASYILAFLGIFTGALAIAMKDLIVNIAGGIYILWVSPFKIGDRIEIGGHIGDVIDTGILQFSILEVGNRISGEQSTGRIVHIPNMQVLNISLANYEKGFQYIWNEIKVEVTLTSDWEQAKEVIYNIVNEYTSEDIENAKTQIHQANKKYMIYYANLTPIVYTDVREGKIILTIRYLCEPRKIRTTEHFLWEQLLRELSKEENVTLI